MSRAIYASTKNSDMRYLVGIEVHDPFFFLDLGKKKHVFLDRREAGVFREKNRNKNMELILVEPFINEAAKNKDETDPANKLAFVIFQKYRLANSAIEVPANFPLDMADYLRFKGYKIVPMKPFLPSRALKNETEIGHIRDSLQKTLKAFNKIEEILKASKISGDKIIYKNSPLTSEYLKSEAEKVLSENGLIDEEGMIVSSGPDTAIPHHQGSGSIKPHQSIICDIFPRHRQSGYFADITRTYVKGRPSKHFSKMYDTVLCAQEKAMAGIRAGVATKDVHRICVDIFISEGFHAGDKGFMHSTGHSLGLDVHDGLRINAFSDHIFEPGNVFTVEPGLYYPNHGGVRIEDVVVVTEDGCENLTNYHKKLVIR